MQIQPPDAPDYGHCLKCSRFVVEAEQKEGICLDCQADECAHSYANKLGCPECGVDFGANPELVKALESLILFTKPSSFNAAALANAYRALNATNSLSPEAERQAAVKDIHSHRVREMTPHTPGPWTIGTDNVVYDEKHRDPICDASFRSEQVSSANALLIASAPDLLTALQEFVAASFPVSKVIDERGYSWSESYLDAALGSARSAIARAKGEA